MNDFPEVKEHLEIRNEIGAGGMGRVYLAYDKNLERKVCLKFLLTTRPAPTDLLRFQREAKAMAKINHPNVVQVHEMAFAGDGRPYLIMEYVPGGSLADQIETARMQGEDIPAHYALQIMRQVAEGLRAIHEEKIVHRDLKPENILLRPSSETAALPTALIADLGIVATNSLHRLTTHGKLIGTAAYMSPEQATGAQVTAQTDIYACGIILFEMLTGRRPFDGTPPQVLEMHKHQPAPNVNLYRYGLPTAVVELVESCLQKSLDLRLQTATALIKALDQAIAATLAPEPVIGRPPVPHPSPAPSTPANPPPMTTTEESILTDYRRFWLYGGGAALLLLVFGFVLFNIFPVRLAQNPTPQATNGAMPLGIAAEAAGTAAEAPTDTPEVFIVTPTPEPTLPPATPTTAPTSTLVPTVALATSTAVPLPTSTPLPTLAPGDGTTGNDSTGSSNFSTSPCQDSIGSPWENSYYQQYQQQLGCPVGAASYPEAAYQIFNKGIMVWRADKNDVIILYYIDGTYEVYSANNIPQAYSGQTDMLKGAFGYLWNTYDTIAARIQNPTIAEANPQDFVIQDFSGGMIFYFRENNSNTYVLFSQDRSWFTPFD